MQGFGVIIFLPVTQRDLEPALSGVGDGRRGEMFCAGIDSILTGVLCDFFK